MLSPTAAPLEPVKMSRGEDEDHAEEADPTSADRTGRQQQQQTAQEVVARQVGVVEGQRGATAVLGRDTGHSIEPG